MASPDLDALARRIAAQVADRTWDRLTVPESAVQIVAAALRDTDAAARAEGFAEGALAMREAAALVADAYADVNIEAAGDTLMADPVLRGAPVTADSITKSESLMIDGCVHSSMFHAAQNIAAAVRALPLPTIGEKSS